MSTRCTPFVLGAPPSCRQGGASVGVVRREGRWKSDAYKVCAHGVDAKVVSDILADTDAQPALQPGQKTMRDING